MENKAAHKNIEECILLFFSATSCATLQTITRLTNCRFRSQVKEKGGKHTHTHPHHNKQTAITVSVRVTSEIRKFVWRWPSRNRFDLDSRYAQCLINTLSKQTAPKYIYKTVHTYALTSIRRKCILSISISIVWSHCYHFITELLKRILFSLKKPNQFGFFFPFSRQMCGVVYLMWWAAHAHAYTEKSLRLSAT